MLSPVSEGRCVKRVTCLHCFNIGWGWGGWGGGEKTNKKQQPNLVNAMNIRCRLLCVFILSCSWKKMSNIFVVYTSET